MDKNKVSIFMGGFSLGIIFMGIIFVLLFLIAGNPYDCASPTNKRVKELSYGTITWVYLDSNEVNLFRVGDTFFLDRKNHRPDVLMYDATRAVIIK